MAEAKVKTEPLVWVKDNASFFRPEEVPANLDVLRISERAKKKWRRFLQLYPSSD